MGSIKTCQEFVRREKLAQIPEKCGLLELKVECRKGPAQPNATFSQ